jgi:hypothetical protein
MSNKINFGVDYTGQLKGGDPASDLPPMEGHCAIGRPRIFLRCNALGDSRRCLFGGNFNQHLRTLII